MKILEGGGRRRLGRRASVLVGAGALMVFQAIGIVGAQVALAASCSFVGGVLTVNSTAAEAIDVSRDVAGAIAIPACVGGTGGATVANTTMIDINGDVNEQDVSIDLANGGFGAIDWTIDVDGTSVGTDQQLVIFGDPAVDNTIILGTSGVDLNGDENLDITALTGLTTSVANPWAVFVFSGGGDDVLSAAGDATTGGPFAQGVFLETFGATGQIAGGAADDFLLGASGFDILDCSVATAATVHIPDGGSNATFGGGAANAGDTCGGGSDFWTGFDGVIGSPGTDSLIDEAGLAGQYFAPNAGVDTITGSVGPDTLDLSVGAVGPFSVDTAAGTATPVGGAAVEDTFTGLFDVVGTSFLTDELNFSGETGPVTANLGNVALGALDSLCGVLAANLVTGATTVNSSMAFENALGSPAGDTIAGSNADRNDLRGGDGADFLCGLGGNDVIIGGLGNDTLDGGTGFDFTSYEDNTTNGVTVDLAVGFASSLESGDDTLVNFENVNGSPFNDNLRGNTSNNTIKGLGGKDNIRLGAGDDTGRGGAGNDILRGGTGDDDLFGGKGNDSLFGGAGVDLCRGGPGKDKIRGCEIGHA